MNIQNLIRPELRDFTPYSTARSEFEGESMVFLDANESPFADEELSLKVQNLNRYPDPRQKELRTEVEYQAKLLGASDVSFAPWVGFVKSGSEKTKDPTSYPLDKGLESKTSIAFDVGFVLGGYCSDFGRSLYFGPAENKVKKGYEALQQSVVETVDKMRSGSMRVCDIFPAIEKTLDRLGYGNYLRARLPNKSVGHNIGVEVHEPPWLDPKNKDLLQTNMVIAVEPKLWNAGEYYFRVEDIVLIGPKKAEFLTQFNRELFQL